MIFFSTKVGKFQNTIAGESLKTVDVGAYPGGTEAWSSDGKSSKGPGLLHNLGAWSVDGKMVHEPAMVNRPGVQSADDPWMGLMLE